MKRSSKYSSSIDLIINDLFRSGNEQSLEKLEILLDQFSSDQIDRQDLFQSLQQMSYFETLHRRVRFLLIDRLNRVTSFFSLKRFLNEFVF